MDGFVRDDGAERDVEPVCLRPAVLRVLEKVGAAALVVSERTEGRVREAFVSLTREEGEALEEAARSFGPVVRLVERGVQVVEGKPVWAKVAW